MAESDFALIQGCRQGKQATWGQLLDQYERLVYSIPLNYGLSSEDAADIAQLTFTIFMQSVDSLRDDSHLAAWLATVARRHSWRLLERRRREHVSPNGDLTEQMELLGDPDAGKALERSEMVEWLHHGLTLLDERCRTLLLALYFDAEQPSYTDVASRLKMAVGSIGPTRARCLQRMRELLEPA
ncbi:MAG: sigma-70 family RNA polymerase sigma factor [Ardenticatenales bacterium]|nr:sigma-70 family RNA polymerase sigma factor [Ardenticatenales bacterium]